ncbi:17960_t:CDS:2, partial [Racocetra fulgida]
TIQEIWRQSRLIFMPYRQMGPPEGMNEKEYVRFLVEDKCYFCGRRNKNSRIYWERGRNITEQIEKEMDSRFFEDMAAKKVQKTERKHAIDARINELCLEMNENGTHKYLRKYLDQCHSLKNSYKYIRPFTEKAWRVLKRK